MDYMKKIPELHMLTLPLINKLRGSGQATAKLLMSHSFNKYWLSTYYVQSLIRKIEFKSW